MKSSEYVNQERRDYSLYVLQQRAVPHAADGLKAAARRLLWTARDGKTYKSAALAGAVAPIHPHAAPERTVGTLAAPYGNNIPLLSGDGAFGTLLQPNAYASTRYTAVSMSQFAKDVLLRDIEIVPMQENYDGTLLEPKHFLPLVPLVLLNPQEGIAVGFASDTLPRDLSDIIEGQINYLLGRPFVDAFPSFAPTQQRAQDWLEDENGQMIKFVFHGSFVKTNATTIRVTNLPYGLTHEKFISNLLKLADKGGIYFDPSEDDNSQAHYDILVRFKKGTLHKMSDLDVLNYVGLINAKSENMTIIDFDGKRVLETSYSELISTFCEWRLKWYVQRYERLAQLLEIDIQRYKDILRAIYRNIGAVAKKVASKNELKEYLREIGIVYIDYITELPVYRFTNEEREKTEKKLGDAEALMKEYKALLKSPSKRKRVYISELQEVLDRYRTGRYTTK